MLNPSFPLLPLYQNFTAASPSSPPNCRQPSNSLALQNRISTRCFILHFLPSPPGLGCHQVQDSARRPEAPSKPSAAPRRPHPGRLLASTRPRPCAPHGACPGRRPVPHDACPNCGKPPPCTARDACPSRRRSSPFAPRGAHRAPSPTPLTPSPARGGHRSARTPPRRRLAAVPFSSRT
jgi:hypothetical protein